MIIRSTKLSLLPSPCYAVVLMPHNMDINSIASAFTWSDTDEGGDFWKGIDNVTAAEFTF